MARTERTADLFRLQRLEELIETFCPKKHRLASVRLSVLVFMLAVTCQHSIKQDAMNTIA